MLVPGAMKVVTWNVALATPIFTVANADVLGWLEDVSRNLTVWLLEMVPGALVKGPPLMLYSPPCTRIGALVMPVMKTAFEVTCVLSGALITSSNLNGAGSADSGSTGTALPKRTCPKSAGSNPSQC